MRDHSASIVDGLIKYIEHLEKENSEYVQTNRDRLKRIDDLREEKLLVEDQLKSAHAKLETIEKINKSLGQRVISDPADMQMICLALAELALHRPGFDYAITLVAEKLGGDVAQKHLTAFKQTSADLCKPYDLLHRSSDPKDDPTPGQQGGG